MRRALPDLNVTVKPEPVSQAAPEVLVECPLAQDRTAFFTEVSRHCDLTGLTPRWHGELSAQPALVLSHRMEPDERLASATMAEAPSLRHSRLNLTLALRKLRRARRFAVASCVFLCVSMTSALIGWLSLPKPPAKLEHALAAGAPDRIDIQLVGCERFEMGPLGAARHHSRSSSSPPKG